MSTFSIIIPNYNHGQFLVKRIETILNQSYKRFELIILDDCSTDNSKEIINLYRSNPYISHVIFNETNSGSPFIQWEKGIKLAKGFFIWIAESDDYVTQNFLEEVLKRFEIDKDIGIVYCDSNVVTNENILEDFYKNYRNKRFKTTRWDIDFVSNGKKEISDYLLFENTINNTSAMVFKKALTNKNTFKDLYKFRYSGDWYFFLQIAYGCKISYISKALNYFRSGQDNFKEGVKTPLNYFKERSLVRYLTIHNFPYHKNQVSKVMDELGKELKYQIYDLLKGKIKLKDFYDVCTQLYKTNRTLFIQQLINIF